MEMAPKALYNSLRMSYLHDQSVDIEAWKVEDLRKVPLETLFSRLKQKDIVLDRASFSAYAYEFDSPEELAIALIPETDVEPDAAFLLLFELWRRLVPEKQSISLVCDELDYQISLYDMGELERVETLDDALQSFYSVLEENVDSGILPEEAFSALTWACAHDIAQFLYDYISEIIGDDEHVYALELIERYYPFVQDKRYFEFLQAQLDSHDAPRVAYERIKSILVASDLVPNVALYIDILTFLRNGLFPDLFCEVAKRVIPLLSESEDFEEFLSLCQQFFSSRGEGVKLSRLEQCMANKTELTKLFTH